MDPAPAIGIGGGFVVVVAANVMEGGNPMSLLLGPPLLLVFGTTILISIAGGTMIDAKNIVSSLKMAFTGKVDPPGAMIPEVVSLAERARREGLLSLEESLSTIDDPFLVKGVTMAIDGTDPEEVRDILEAEVYAKRAEDKQRARSSVHHGRFPHARTSTATAMSRRLIHDRYSRIPRPFRFARANLTRLCDERICQAQLTSSHRKLTYPARALS